MLTLNTFPLYNINYPIDIIPDETIQWSYTLSTSLHNFDLNTDTNLSDTNITISNTYIGNIYLLISYIYQYVIDNVIILIFNNNNLDDSIITHTSEAQLPFLAQLITDKYSIILNFETTLFLDLLKLSIYRRYNLYISTIQAKQYYPRSLINNQITHFTFDNKPLFIIN